MICLRSGAAKGFITPGFLRLRRALFQSDAKDFGAAKHMGLLPASRKQRRESRIVNIQPAGIGAKRRQNTALRIGEKTATPRRAGSANHSRRWMQMAGDLARGASLRLMPQRQWAQCHSGLLPITRGYGPGSDCR